MVLVRGPNDETNLPSEIDITKKLNGVESITVAMLLKDELELIGGTVCCLFLSKGGPRPHPMEETHFDRLYL